MSRVLDERIDAGAELLFEHFHAVFHEDAVFAEQRHDVGHGAERDEVQHLLHVGRVAALVVGAAVDHERMGELERHADARQMQQVVQPDRVELRIDGGERFGQFVRGLVVVRDDDVDAEFAGLLHGLRAVDAAVDRDEYAAFPAGHRLQSLQQGIGREPVSVVEPMRQKRCDQAPVAFEDPRQQRRGRDSVRIVVPVDEDAFTIPDRLPKPLDGNFYAGKSERITQIREGRVQIAAQRLRSNAS